MSSTAMMMRIALAGLFEEVDTFADETMGKAKITDNMTTGFQQWTDKAILDEYRGSKTYMGGFIAALEEFPGVEIVPTAFWSFSAGGTIDGKGGKLGGEPIRGKAYVKSISDGRYTIVSPMGAGTKFDVGPAVELLIEGVDVAVISGLMQAFDANQMKMLGFDPQGYRIVVVKSANHFRAWWTDVASAIIDCDPPDIASNDLSTFAFQKKTRKVFPLDTDAVYPEPGARKI